MLFVLFCHLFFQNMVMVEHSENKRGHISSSFNPLVYYTAPCGLKLANIDKVASYLKATEHEALSVDNFTFDPNVRPNVLASSDPEWVVMEDFSDGAERIP